MDIQVRAVEEMEHVVAKTPKPNATGEPRIAAQLVKLMSVCLAAAADQVQRGIGVGGRNLCKRARQQINSLVWSNLADKEDVALALKRCERGRVPARPAGHIHDHR